jgi:enamine deaminase RidA (YjgF/YER057c/UK114 family)
MPKQQITSSKIRQPSGHFSHATMVEARGRIVFVSGMTARRPDGTIAGIGDVEAQTRQVCENLKAAVEEAGGSMDDICRVDVYVRNMEHFEQIHKVRREYFCPPARHAAGRRRVRIESVVLDHGTPCLALAVQEKLRINVWREGLDLLELPVGPWLNEAAD